MRRKSLICRIFGHDTIDQPIQSVGSTRGRKMHDEFGNPLTHPIAYHMQACARCGRRQPLTQEDAELQRELNDYMNDVMNGSRKQHGLGWLDFSDGP